jgi:hypothetical protein
MHYLHCPSQGRLGLGSHGVGLVQDDDLEGGARVASCFLQAGHRELSELLDFLSHNLDPSFVRGIQFKYA